MRVVLLETQFAPVEGEDSQNWIYIPAGTKGTVARAHAEKITVHWDKAFVGDNEVNWCEWDTPCTAIALVDEPAPRKVADYDSAVSLLLDAVEEVVVCRDERQHIELVATLDDDRVFYTVVDDLKEVTHEHDLTTFDEGIKEFRRAVGVGMPT